MEDVHLHPLQTAEAEVEGLEPIAVSSPTPLHLNKSCSKTIP